MNNVWTICYRCCLQHCKLTFRIAKLCISLDLFTKYMYVNLIANLNIRKYISPLFHASFQITFQKFPVQRDLKWPPAYVFISLHMICDGMAYWVMKYDESWFSMPLEAFSHFHLLLFGGDFLHIFTARKRSLGQGNVFTPVILFTGECLSHCMREYTPPGHTPPSPHGYHRIVNKRVVRILLESILVSILLWMLEHSYLHSEICYIFIWMSAQWFTLPISFVEFHFHKNWIVHLVLKEYRYILHFTTFLRRNKGFFK